MTKKYCSKCNTKLGIGKLKLPLVNKDEEEILLCSDCYNALSKEEKLKLQPLKNINKSSKQTMGLGFVVGGAFGALGAAEGENSFILRYIKKFNLNYNQLNNYSIMNHNRHFLFCDSNLRIQLLIEMGKEIETKKINELSRTNFSREYDTLEKDDQKKIKKELKINYYKPNLRNNKKLKSFNDFLKREDLL